MSALTVRFFAAAAEAAGVPEIVVAPVSNRGELEEKLQASFGAELARLLPVCAWVADGAVIDQHTCLAEVELIDVLPPFAGG